MTYTSFLAYSSLNLANDYRSSQILLFTDENLWSENLLFNWIEEESRATSHQCILYSTLVAIKIDLICDLNKSDSVTGYFNVTVF